MLIIKEEVWSLRREWVKVERLGRQCRFKISYGVQDEQRSVENKMDKI